MEVDCVWRLGPMFQALKEATSWFAIIQAKLSRRWWPPTVRRRAAGNQKEIRGKAIGRRKERREEGKRDPHPPHSSPVWFQPIAVAGRSSRSQCCCCNRFFRFSTVLTGCLTMIPVFFWDFCTLQWFRWIAAAAKTLPRPRCGGFLYHGFLKSDWRFFGFIVFSLSRFFLHSETLVLRGRGRSFCCCWKVASKSMLQTKLQ